MIERIIHFSIKNKLIIGIMVLALVAWGIYSISRLPVDAVPDITNNQVQVISVAPSLAAQEVESFITAPVEVSVANIPNLIELRSISRLGLSVVTIVFEDDVDIYWARQQISERLREAEKQIPPGVADINLAPVSTGLGEIFQYSLEVEKGYEKKYPLMELRTLQDWVVRRQMLGTPGVADVNSYGGFVNQYEIAVNPERLRSLNLSLSDVFTALEQNNENTGSAYLDKKPNAYFIRGIGLATSLDDIEKILIKTTPQGMPVLIRDIGTVQYGHAARYGALVEDTTEAVGGVVMMLKGANGAKVVADVKQKIETIQKSLPQGVSIQAYLDRTDLVNRAIHTVTLNLTEGALIVIFILVLLLGNIRAGIIVASVIPLAMLFALSMMNLFGISGNLMSLGAIDFGLIVDGAVIIVESVVHRLQHSASSQKERLSQVQMDENVSISTKRMMSSATFGQIIILIVYLPILSLIGIEGKMFKPMAQVVAFAIVGATILSLTWIPMASSLFLSKSYKPKQSFSDKWIRTLYKFFIPLIINAFRKKAIYLTTAFIVFLGSILLFSRLGGEFIPQLEEGDLAASVITLQGGSLSHTVEMVEKANKILKDNFPEIKHVICKIGAGEIPTDPTPMETGDYIITLKDKKEWTTAKTRSELVEKMEEKLAVLAGVKFEFQQPIQMRFNELMSGSKQDVAIKLFGDNLEQMASNAEDIEKIIKTIEGVEDINVEKITGLSQIQVQLNRERIAQYGLSIAEVNKILRTAFAGSSAGVIYNEDRRFDMVVRLGTDFRQSLDDVKNLAVELPSGLQIPLDQLADIALKSGPAQVSRENTKRRITIGFNTRKRDVESIIREVKENINSRIRLPEGYYITYGGQFENLVAARERLAIAVPIALLLIFILLFFTFQSVQQALLIYSAVPLASIGGILALWSRDMNFSISAGVGFIALFGVAVLNGIVLIAEFNRLEKKGIQNIYRRVLKGLQTRFRPVIITAGVASLGFFPMALSTSAGAEVQKPLATVVIGGLVTSTLLTLVILPILYVLFYQNRKKLKTAVMKKAFSLLILVAITSFTTRSLAQSTEKIELNQAIKLALDSNLMLQTSAYEIEYQKAAKKASWDLAKTSVDIEYGQLNSFAKDNKVSVQQSFAFPLLYIQQEKLGKANILDSELKHQIKQAELSSLIKSTYWHLVYLFSKKSLLLYQDSIFSGFARAAQRKAESGETNRLEMITARSQSMEVKNQLQQTTADISIFIRKFRGLINTSRYFIPKDTVLLKLTFVPVEKKISDANPELKHAQHQILIAQIEKKTESAKLFPEFTIGYFNQSIIGNQEVNGVNFNYKSSDRFTGIQAGVAIPLWARPHVAKIKAAAVNEKMAEKAALNLENGLNINYQSLMDEYNKYQSSVSYYENQALPEAQLIIIQSEKSYKAGALDYLEYIQSLNRALSIRQAYLEALQNFNQTIINLEYITGKTI